MMTSRLRRLPMWEGYLAALVTERMRAPFAWGSNDCLSFAFDAVRALTGEDAIADWRGRWHDRASALAGLTRYCGFPCVAQAMTKKAQEMGWPPVSPLLAQRGDLVVLRGRLAVMIGSGAATPGATGLVIEMPPADALAWSI